MFGAALSRGQLDRLVALVDEHEGHGDTVIGLVLENPRGRAVTITLIDQDGEAFVEETFVGFEEGDPSLLHPAVIAA